MQSVSPTALGVAIQKPIPDQKKIQCLFTKLVNSLDRKDVTKEEIVQIITEYLLNFKHIEMGRSLDSKM